MMSWVDNNQLQTVVWSQVEEDFQEASIDQGAGGRPILTSSYWPQLVDVDQDGWLDLITFTRIGMVNGAFDIFFFDPDAGHFNSAQTILGHTLERDKLGYIVSTGRSGPGWTYNVSTLSNRELTLLFEVEPYGRGRSGSQFGQDCDVSLGDQEPLQIGDILASGQIDDGEAFFADYCDTAPDSGVNGRAEPLQEERASTDRAPSNTLFYCALAEGTKAVTIAREPHGFLYTYGPTGAEPELELGRSFDEIRIRRRASSEDADADTITFTDGAYEYVVYRTDEPMAKTGAAVQNTQNGALRVRTH